MPTVAFSTFAHPSYLVKLHAPGVFEEIVASHRYRFNEMLVVHQRCKGLQYRPLWPDVRIVESEDYYPQIYNRFHIDLDNPVATRDCGGPDAHYWWVWHTLNHLIVLEEAKSDYIVFNDCDCRIIISDPQTSWVEEAIRILIGHPEVLVVAPGDGGDIHEANIPEARLTRNVSQCLFIASRERLKAMDWDVSFNWEKTAPGVGQEFREFYHCAEGRIWRYLDKHELWRAVLPDKWRWWNFGDWEPQGWIEAGRP